MPLRTYAEIVASIKTTLRALSPQIRIDADKGPFFYLSANAAARPLADASADVERVAQLSTFQFPEVATESEILSTARAFAQTPGSGSFASGLAYVVTSRRPLGTETFTVLEGDTFATANVGGVVFEAIEARSLTAANADAFYNPSTRRYELSVTVQAVSAGTAGNIPPRTLTTIIGGSNVFDGVTNIAEFVGGEEAQSARALYTRVQERFLGQDDFSRGGLISRIQNVDVDRIRAVALTYSTEYPALFFRLPDTQAVDAWVRNTVLPAQTTQTFTATSGQTQFVLSQAPVLSLLNVFVNGSPVSASLTLDESLEVGRSTREQSFVALSVAAVGNDIVDITYTYDTVLRAAQSEIDGYLQQDTGALFATDVLLRYAQPLPVVIEIVGSALGTFDPTTLEQETASAVATYLANGATSLVPALGGTRSPAELRDVLRASVPGIAGLGISVFSRKIVSPLVETVDIPRNAYPVLEDAADLIVTFT